MSTLYFEICLWLIGLELAGQFQASHSSSVLGLRLYHYAHLLYMDSGDRTQVLVLAKQVLYENQILSALSDA